MIPDEIVRKAMLALKQYATSDRGRDADVYFNADNIARAALEAVWDSLPNVPAAGAEAKLIETIERQNQRLAAVAAERDLLANEARAFRLETQKRDEMVRARLDALRAEMDEGTEKVADGEFDKGWRRAARWYLTKLDAAIRDLCGEGKRRGRKEAYDTKSKGSCHQS